MRITTLASGSSGNCTVITSGSGCLLIDAGISMRRIKAGLARLGLLPENVGGILITHEHSDHVSGLPMLLKHYDIPVFAPRTVANHLRWSHAGVDERLTEIVPGENNTIAGMAVRAFHTPHDTDESVGYRIEDGCVFALATDMGCVTDEILSGVMGADAVIIEANHDEQMLRYGNYPFALKRRILSDHGHLSNADCARLARLLAENGTRYIILGHLSRENNTPALAERTVAAALEGLDVRLFTAPEASPLDIELERSTVL